MMHGNFIFSFFTNWPEIISGAIALYMFIKNKRVIAMYRDLYASLQFSLSSLYIL